MGAATNGSGRQAVAVVGAGCRLPGGLDDLGSLWDALEEGRDLVGRIPEDRFETARFVDESRPRPGKSYTAAGAFLEDVAGFDADYFGISPKEAAHMDPQHRLLLEMTAEALDDAAIDPAGLAGGPTGVFVGISDSSYGALQMMTTERITPYTASGGAHSIAANRVSHAFGLHGPSMAVDTACSSSLIALERACSQVAADGGTVLAGGVNVLIAPYAYIAFSQAAMLSAKGRCAAFSAGADGFVRAEGGGMVVLKRLSDALADGDRIHGVLAGWGSNSDGRTAGLALPNSRAQEELLRSVYADAGVSPDELVYMEAHGTGTLVGDPAECEAIGRALARGRSHPLPVGSVKSNLGHLEPASGMAGLFKALLVLRHGRIPASLHAEPLNPRIDFDGLGLSPAVEASTVQAIGEGHRAVGVNSFGFGGANAHVIVAAPPEPAAGADGGGSGHGARTAATPVAPPESPTAEAAGTPPPPVHAPAHERPRLPVVVSARTPEALSAAAERMADRLSTADADEFYDLAYTSCLRRGAHSHRLAVLAATPGDAAEQLRAADAAAAAPAAEDGRVAFVYCGNGSQWAGMGADLLAGDPVFADAVAEVDACLTPYLDWSVAAEMALPREQWRLESTEVAQPLLFTVQVALTRLLAADGVTPAAAVGHSVGEAAAAWAAGALTLDQAARVVAARGRAQAPTAGSGRMAAANLSREQAEELLKGFPGVEVAGVNSECDVTLAGPEGRIKQVGDELERRGVFFRQLDLDYAFHSSAMDAVRDPLLADLEGLAPAPVRIPLASTATGELVEGTELGAEHWWRGIREPVLFGAAVQRLRERGIGVFTEVGPHPVLRSYLRRCLGAAKERHALTATLSRDTDGAAADKAVAAVMAAGADVDWRGCHFPAPGRVTALPAYPWQREHHWSGTKHDWAAAAAGPIDHPLLGERKTAAAPSWDGAIEPVRVPWLVDHKIVGGVVFPATGYLEMALTAGRRVLEAPVEADGWEFVRPLLIPWEDPSSVRVQTLLTERDGVTSITSTEHGGETRAHARGRVRRLVGSAPAALDLAGARARCDRRINAADMYAGVADRGLQYGPAFQTLRDVYAGEGEVLASYRHDAPSGESGEFCVHPALLDGAFHSGAPLTEDLTDQAAFLPAKVGALRVWATPPPQGWIRVNDRTRTSTELCWDIVITDEQGNVAVEVDGLRCRRLASSNRPPLEIQRSVLRAAPLAESPASVGPLRPTPRVEARAADAIGRARDAWHETDYADFARRAREGTFRGIAVSLAELLPQLHEGGAAESDIENLGLRAPHLRAVRTMLPMLEEEGVLQRRDGARWELSISTGAAHATFREGLRRHPSSMLELCLGLHQIRQLPAVMRGECEAVELLTRPGAADFLRQFFATSPRLVIAYRVAASLLEVIAADWPADRPLRVLEIGGGTAGFTGALLPVLPPERTRYTFTDVSPFFFAPAQKQLADYDFVDYQTLDLDTDPVDQGFTKGGYDIVVAANALHTARDMSAALPRVASLLAPGGRLLAVENHDNDLAVGIFGLLETFWDFADTDLRPGGAFLERDQWPELLRRCGFSDVVQTGDDRRPAADHVSVLMATAEHRSEEARPAQAAPTAPEAAVHHVIAAESDSEIELATALAGWFHHAEAVVAPGDTAGWTSLLARADQPVSITVVFAEPDPDDAVGETTRRAAVLRSLVAAGTSGGEDAPRGLTLVTRPSGVHAAPERSDFPGDAAVWGMARTLANECFDMAVTRISLERSGDADADARRLAAELDTESAENEVVLTAQGRFVPRLVEDRPALSADSCGGYGLEVVDQGLNFTVRWRQTTTPAPGPGMVAIDVRAAALNYRDIMQASGLLPAEATEDTVAGTDLGLECAGVVAAVGAGVDNVAVGDRVLAIAPAALASRTVTHAHAVDRIPEHMSFTEAATVPVAFATVHYSLEEVARLREGETMLVHGGAGGVGLAALEYARLRGAEVIATAGTDIKRETLRALGVEHVLDSRSLDFADQVTELTGGRGADVVLNSLAGEAMVRSLEVLAPGGRFIELGKRDIMEDNPLPLRPFADNISFSGVDLSSLIDRGDVLAEHWRQVVRRLHDGEYRPLPHTVYPASQAQEAFAMLQHSRHIGKVVIALDELSAPATVRAVPGQARLELDASGTYLVTGGLGGFGAATARHLAERGARKLALVSRRGEDSPEAPELLADLAAQGVTATAYAADCADAEAMGGVLRDIEESGYRLRGVVHAAMTLDDDDFTELTDARFAAPLRAKMGGLAVIDAATRGMELDLFWAYSSVAAHLGNIRQANYNAANLYTEALVRNRRARGEAGIAVAWGHIDDVGYVERTGSGEFIAKMGLAPVASSEGLAVLDELQHGAEDWDVANICRLSWGAIRAALADTAGSPRISLLPGVAGGESGAAQQELIERIQGLAPADAHRVLSEHLADVLAEVLQTGAERLDHHRRLDEYGVDSLMAADLLAVINRNYSVEVPPLEFLRGGGTISDIAETLLLRIGAGGGGSPAGGGAQGADGRGTDPAQEAERTGEGSASAGF